ncbi:beta-eliminating lyase-related protein [Streptomyces chartreusis]
MPSPPRSRTTFSRPANCVTRSPVNVSTHARSALNTPAIHRRCPVHVLDRTESFKGNIDTARLKAVLDGPDGSRIAAVIMTITNNGGGSQPVSMANLTLTSSICRERACPCSWTRRGSRRTPGW